MSQLEQTAADAELSGSPYVGLRNFTEGSAEYFFGRDRDRSVIISNLRASRLTLLYAESGVGKSSLLRAGVAVTIREQTWSQWWEESGAPTLLPVVFSTWAPPPVLTLIEAIEAEVRHVVFAAQLPRTSLYDALEAAASLTSSTVLVILDQFEEFFLYHTYSGFGPGFADELARCINAPQLAANFLISIREDSYASLGDLLDSRVDNIYGNFLHLDYLDAASAREAIIRPIEHFNTLHPELPPVIIEPALVDSVLSQVRRGQVNEDAANDSDLEWHSGTEGIETTYMQLVMKRLWDEEMRIGSRQLRLATLESLGGAQRIIATHLDSSMALLTPEQQQTAASCLRFLVTATGTKIALTTTDLEELTDLPAAHIDQVLRRLSQPDLHILRAVTLHESAGVPPVHRVDIDLTESGGARLAEEPRFEIYHDALASPILNWRARYRRWVEQYELQASLEAARVEQARAEAERLVAQEQARKERRRRRRAVGSLVVTVALLVASLTYFGWWRSHKAAQRNQAIVEATDSVNHMAQMQGPDYGLGAVALASDEAIRVAPDSFEARSTALAALQENAGFPVLSTGHYRAVQAVTFLSNSLYASGGSDGTLRLWKRNGQAAVAPITTRLSGDFENSQFESVASRRVSGSFLLAAGRGDGHLDLWRVTASAGGSVHVGGVVARSLGKSSIRSVAFSPDGTRLVTGDEDGVLTMWTVGEDGRLTPAGQNSLGAGDIYGLAFSPDGTRLAVAGRNNLLVLPGATPTDPAAIPPAGSPDRDDTGSYAVAYSSNGVLADAVNNATNPGVELVSATGDTEFLPATDQVNAVAFGSGGTVLVAGGVDSNVTTWNLRSGREFGPPRNDDGYDAVKAVAVSPDGTTVVEGDDSDRVKLWPIEGGPTLASTIGSVGLADLPSSDAGSLPNIYSVALLPGDRIVGAADDAGTLIWSTTAGRTTNLIPRTVIKPIGGRQSFSVASAGNTLLVGSGNRIDVFDTGCQTMPKTPCRGGHAEVAGKYVQQLSVDRSGRLLASAEDGGHLEIWSFDHRTIHHVASYRMGSALLTSAVFSPHSDLLAASSDDGSIRVYRVDPSGHLHLLGKVSDAHHGLPVTQVAFAPRDVTTTDRHVTLLASGGQDQHLALWSVDPTAKHPVVPVNAGEQQTNTVSAVAFSSDGSVLAAGDGDGSTCLYDVRTLATIGSGTCLLQHWSSTNLTGIWTAVFRKDGTLFTAGMGNGVVAWSPVLSSVRGRDRSITRSVCQLARRNLTSKEWKESFAGTSLASQRHRTCANYPLRN